MQTGRHNATGGVILVALGLIFLIANFTEMRGWGFLLGIGVAFLAAALWSNRYGLVVAGCLLTALGLVGLPEHNRWLVGDRGVTFLLVMGLGFIAIYPLGRRWHLWWPFIPGLVLLWVGLVPTLIAQAGWLSLREWAGLVRWWPLLLVVPGAWVTVRHRLEPRTERMARIAVIVAVVAIALVLLTAMAASVATESAQVPFSPQWRTPRLWW